MDAPTIVLGLGNPGARYRATRHNVGFRVVDLVARRRGAAWREPEELKGRARVAEFAGPAGTVVLAKPRTYMNRSGHAALALCRRYARMPAELLVVYDDADLELGRIRVRHEGGTGGHNGVRSLMETLGDGRFPRVRMGIRGEGRELEELAEYVLDGFEPDEEPRVGAMVQRAAQAVETALERGVEYAMNRFNVRPTPEDDP